MKFNSRDEFIDWLTEKAKQKLFADVMQLLNQGMDRDHVMNELAPAMVAHAMAERDEFVSTVDALVMDFNANTPEHTTVN
jgi:hypothetical protein